MWICQMQVMVVIFLLPIVIQFLWIYSLFVLILGGLNFHSSAKIMQKEN